MMLPAFTDRIVDQKIKNIMVVGGGQLALSCFTAQTKRHESKDNRN